MKNFGIIIILIFTKIGLSAPAQKNTIQILQAGAATKQTAANQIAKILPSLKGQKRAQALERLAILYSEIAAIQFEIGGDQLQKSKETHEKVIQAAAEAAAERNSVGTQARLMLLRGQSYKELGKNSLALADFKYVVFTLPANDEAYKAAFLAYDLNVDAHDYSLNKAFLEKVALQPGNAYFFVYNEYYSQTLLQLQELDKALKQVQVSLQLTQEGQDGSDSLQRSSLFHRRTIFGTAAQVFAVGIEKKLPNFQIESTLGFFRTYLRSEEIPKVIAEFAIQLRVRNLDEELEKLAGMVSSMGEFGSAFAASRISTELVVLDYSVNRRNGPAIEKSANRLKTYFSETSSFNPQARVQLLKIIDSVKGAKDQELSWLASIYDCLVAIPKTDAKLLVVDHYNAGQVSEAAKDYERAVGHYRWVVQNRGLIQKIDPVHGKFLQDSSFRAILCRYESLKKSQLIPLDLKAKDLTREDDFRMNQAQSEWVEWIEDEKGFSAFPAADLLVYEKNRVLYQFGKARKAIDQFREYTKTYPKSKFALPAALLVVDTSLESKDWKTAILDVRQVLKTPLAFTPDIKSRLENNGAESYFQIIKKINQEGNYDKTMRSVDDALREFPSSQRKNDLIALAAYASIGKKDRKKAQSYFLNLDRKTASKDYLATAALTDAISSEEEFDYIGAKNKFLSFLSSKNDEEIRKKVLLYSWISGNPQELASAFADPKICGGKPEKPECSFYEVILRIVQNQKISLETAIKKASQGNKQDRSAWAVLGLKSSDGASWKDRVLLIHYAMVNWSEQDALEKTFLSSELVALISRVFKQVRPEISRLSPMKISKQAITKRVELVKEAERLLESIDQAGVSDFTIIKNYFIGMLYKDVASEIQSLPVPAGLNKSDLSAYKNTITELSQPFHAKAVEKISLAFDEASEGIMEPQFFALISEEYFQMRPKVAEQLKAKWRAMETSPLFNSLVKLAKIYEKPQLTLFWSKWKAAVDQGNILKATYMILLAQTQRIFQETEFNWAESTLLSKMGLSVESQKLVAGLLQDASKPAQVEYCRILLTGSHRAFSRTQSLKYTEQCRGLADEVGRSMYSAVSDWAKSGMVAKGGSP